MPVRDDIVDVLTRAEDELATRLKRAVKDRDYSDVAELGSVSQKVHELIQSLDENLRAPEPPRTTRFAAVSHSKARDSVGAKSASRVGRTINKAYPRFARDGEQLVKTGWSKKTRAEYRHRVPEFAVSAVVSALRGLGSTEFSMEKLTPVQNEDGTGVPSYQVYLVVAWLRSCGTVRKAGRGGYVSIPESLSAAALKEHWTALDGERVSKGASIDD